MTLEAHNKTWRKKMADVIKLPAAKSKGKLSLEEAIQARRSIRTYSNAPLKLQDVSQLLWAAQGITGPNGLRTAPSPIAVYLVQVYLVAGNVEGLKPGVYSYKPQGHSLEQSREGDLRQQLVGLGQEVFSSGAALLVIASLDEKASKTFGSYAVRASSLEIGHVAQNIALQGTVLDLGLVTATGFDGDKARSLLGLPPNETPVYLIPVGKKA
jgi:SagB-type dehydrogenase family enzyme